MEYPSSSASRWAFYWHTSNVYPPDPPTHPLQARDRLETKGWAAVSFREAPEGGLPFHARRKLARINKELAAFG